jgi:hypothetical protein
MICCSMYCIFHLKKSGSESKFRSEIKAKVGSESRSGKKWIHNTAQGTQTVVATSVQPDPDLVSSDVMCTPASLCSVVIGV